MNNKSEELRSFIDRMAKDLYGWNGKEEHCRTCNKKVGDFKDSLSEKEYKISGMCQECQDSVFGEEG